MGILEGSASVAASFLQTFVNDSLWAHLDIAGTVWQSESDERGPAGATGSAVSLLFELAREVAGSDELQLARP
jgi:leucyl aminopeptidase